MITKTIMIKTLRLIIIGVVTALITIISFNIFLIPESFPLSPNEKKFFIKKTSMIEKHMKTRISNIKTARIFWANMNPEILGCYYFHRDEIYLNSKYRHLRDLLTITLIHELRHRYDYETNKIDYLFYSKKKLEHSAGIAEMEADFILYNLKSFDSKLKSP